MQFHEYVENRRRRYLAQALAPFDDLVQPVLDDLPLTPEQRLALSEATQCFLSGVRRSFRNFTKDLTEPLSDAAPEINAVAVGIRDRVR